MKNIHFLLFFSFVISAGINSTQAQCLNFARNDGFAKLDTSKYIPEGRLNAIPLSEGDNLDVYKPFFRGRKYKIVVIGAENMPKLNFKVTTFQRQTIFDSKENKNTDYWEFVSEKNQNLIISVEIPAAKNGQPQTGCVAVIVGFAQN